MDERGRSDPPRSLAPGSGTPGTITLVRHGQASFWAADYDALSEVGFRQARVLGTALASSAPLPAHVVCGTMRRHRQTAEACLAAMGLSPRWDEDAGWDEYDHRDVIAVFETRSAGHALPGAELARSGRPEEAFLRMFAAAVGRWTSGAHDADYREPWPAFLSRVDAALRRLAPAASGGVLVFTSGGPIAAVCRGLLGLSDDQALRRSWKLVNAGITRIEVGGDGPSLGCFNERGHLEGTQVGLLTWR